jgi:hypothetical protein
MLVCVAFKAKVLLVFKVLLLVLKFLLLGNQPRKKNTEVKKVFKEKCVAQFPLAKPMVDPAIKTHMLTARFVI